MSNHNEIIKNEFTKQAKYFENKGLTLSNQEYLEWMVKSLPLDASFHVLDVAAGTCLLSRAIAKYVKEVVAIDTTLEMLNVAQSEIKKSNISNICLKEGLAESLPFENDFFDMVVSRMAIHHFDKPQLCIDEMSRVCKTGHVVGIIDLLSPEDNILNKRYNYFERLRDPSHTTATTSVEIHGMMKKSNLSICFENTRDIEVDLSKWMEMTKTSSENRKEIESAVKDEISRGKKTGMRPFIKDNAIKFLQTWSIFIGKKTK